jgi:hypothetical protein
VVRLLCSYDRSDGDTLPFMRKYLVEMPCMCCLDGGLRCPPHGPADGFVDALPCHVQTGKRGSPAPMGDGWRSLPGRASPGPDWILSARSATERLHAAWIQP